MSDAKKHYHRVIISGELRCQSNLHIGTGNLIKQDGLEQLLGEFCTDINGDALIPASSLRGYLSHKLSQDKEHETLFGCARKKQTDSDKKGVGSAGKLRVYDARQIKTEEDTCKKNHTRRNRVKIHAITGTAENNMLATQAVVVRGTVFSCRLELDNVDEQLIKRLLGALATLDASTDAQLGQGKSYGQGLLQWELLKVRGIDQSALVEWLSRDKALSYDSAPRLLPLRLLHLKPIKLRNQEWEWQTVHLRLIPETPILIIDHDASFPKQESDQENELSADHVYLQDNHQAVIPGSTLKGLVKARCRKILLTLLPEHDVDAWLMPAFGDMQKGLGYIRFFDATETQQKAYQHEQIFNAIDRFTGGVKHPALYQVKAIQPEAFETRLSWRKTDNVDQDWFFGLMLLVLRDAMEADLTVGWGKAKGFGCFHLELSLDIKSKRKWINDWSGFAKNYQQHTTIQVCLDAFDNKIQSSLLPAEPVA